MQRPDPPRGLSAAVERLLQDRNGDRTADAIILYAPTGKIRQAEIDTDLDGVTDRWEYFEDGTLIRLRFARRKRGVADYWERVAQNGALVQREYDDNGDGTIDRMEPIGASPR